MLTFNKEGALTFEGKNHSKVKTITANQWLLAVKAKWDIRIQRQCISEDQWLGGRPYWGEALASVCLLVGFLGVHDQHAAVCCPETAGLPLNA